MPKDTALHKSAYKGDMVGVENALDDDRIDIDAPGAQKRTALMRACGANHTEMVKFLIGRGACTTQIDNSGRSPMHWAAASGSFDVAEIIANNEAKKSEEDTKLDFNSKTKSGSAPLHLVAESGSAKFLQLLLDNGADINIVDGDGKSPYVLAKEGGHREATALLKPPSEGCACQIL